MSATHPIPGELRKRIQRLREAVWKASASNVSDVPAWWRAIAAAKRALADAYTEAARLAPQGSLLHVAMTDVANNLRDVADCNEDNATEFEALATRLAVGDQA